MQSVWMVKNLDFLRPKLFISCVEEKVFYSVADLAQRYLSDYAELQKKSSSVETDRSNLKNHIVPYLGKMDVKSVSVNEIDGFLQKLANGTLPSCKKKTGKGGGKGVANRCRALLSKMFNLAEKWSLVTNGSNPVKHALRYEENAVERYLSSDEMERLGKALADAEQEGVSVYIVGAIGLLLLTGARAGEVLTLKWEYIDEERSAAFLPTSKTGKKTLPLSDPALGIINAMPKIEGNPHVFAGRVEGQHVINIRKRWGEIRNKAALADVRLHDLRHNFASSAINSGVALDAIAKLLGHKNTQTTQRYAHLADDYVRRLSNDTANAIVKKAGLSKMPCE